MSNVSETSKDAFESIKDKLGSKQEMVYISIQELGRASNEMIASYLKWPINTVTPRVVELRNYGLIGVEGMTKNRSGRAAKMWSTRGLDDKKIEQLVLDCE